MTNRDEFDEAIRDALLRAFAVDPPPDLLDRVLATVERRAARRHRLAVVGLTLAVIGAVSPLLALFLTVLGPALSAIVRGGIAVISQIGTAALNNLTISIAFALAAALLFAAVGRLARARVTS
jgi:hypothetical protein